MSTLNLERSIYIGNALGCILYGLQIYLTFHSVALLSSQYRDDRKRSEKLYIWFSLAMLFVMGFAVSMNTLVGQLMWIEHRNYPGGPVAYFIAKGASWYNITSTTAGIVGDIMSDALLIYRCYIIWSRDWRIIILPVLIYIASEVLALFALVESALPRSGFFVHQSVSFAVPWISLSCALNVLVTCLIAGRILYLRHGVKNILPEETTQVYTGVVAILVESALPFSLIGIVFAISLGKSLPVAWSFTIVWGALVALSPQLIILRVAIGRGWTDATVSQFSGSLVFATNPPAENITEIDNSGPPNLSKTSLTRDAEESNASKQTLNASSWAENVDVAP